MTLIDWGRAAEAVAGRLMEESEKALENGQQYAQLTVAATATHPKHERAGEGRLVKRDSAA